MSQGLPNKDLVALTPSKVTGLEAGVIVSSRISLRHFHDAWQFSWTRWGSGEYCTGTTRFTCEPGSPVLIAPGEVHYSNPAAPWHIDTLLVPEKNLAVALDDAAGGAAGLGSLQVQGSPRLVGVLQRVQRGVVGGEQRLSLDSHFLALATELAAHTGRAVRPSPPPAAAPLQRVREYLETHYRENPSLDDLAKLADLSPVHLTRAFRTLYGLPPHAFLLEVRFNRVWGFLRAGMPLVQAALAAGYHDQAHLTRHFKRRQGRNPSEIRTRA